MQEEMNSAMAQLNESVGADVPSLAEVQDKIQARYAKAKATAELNETSVTSRVLEVEQATANVEAQSRLSELRAELGLGGGAAPEPQPVEQAAQDAPPAELVARPVDPSHLAVAEELLKRGVHRPRARRHVLGSPARSSRCTCDRPSGPVGDALSPRFQSLDHEIGRRAA